MASNNCKLIRAVRYSDADNHISKYGTSNLSINRVVHDLDENNNRKRKSDVNNDNNGDDCNNNVRQFGTGKNVGRRENGSISDLKPKSSTNTKSSFAYDNPSLVFDEDSDARENKSAVSDEITPKQFSSVSKISQTNNNSTIGSLTDGVVSRNGGGRQDCISTDSVSIEESNYASKTPEDKTVVLRNTLNEKSDTSISIFGENLECPISEETGTEVSNDHVEVQINGPKDQLKRPSQAPSVRFQPIKNELEEFEEHSGEPNEHFEHYSRETEKTVDMNIQASKGQVKSRKSALKHRTHSVHPDIVWLEQFESALRSSIDEQNPCVTPERIRDVLQVEQSFFVDRILQLVGGSEGQQQEIDVDSLVEELRAVVHGTQADKLKFLFDIYDIDGGGSIDRNELQQLFTSIINECKLNIEVEHFEELINAFFNTADENNDGKISFEELETVFQKRPAIMNEITISSMFSQKTPQAKPGLDNNKNTKQGDHILRRFSKTYLRNNLKKVVFLLCYFLVNVCLMGVGVYLYWDSNAWIKVARAHGLALNFDCTLVLVFMLRHTITYLRNTPLRHVLPFDQHIWFHRLCGYIIGLLTIGHTIGHVGNCVDTAGSINSTVLEMMFTTEAGIGWVEHTAYITGDVLVLILCVMIVLSLPVVRRSGNFEVFYWSHKLYMIFWALLILHAPHFWMWFVVPGFIFLLEMLARNPWVRKFSHGQTYIEQVSLLPSGVTHLVISRPSSFQFKPGDYIFIQIPSVAKYEWHPFTISSAPENLDEIWVHIRSAGHWTRSLYKYFTDYQPSDMETGECGTENDMDVYNKARMMRRRASSVTWLTNRSTKAKMKTESMRKRKVTKRVKILVHIDGPYGTASRHIFEQEHAVLIGSGIGITPFASILQSIVSRYKASCVQCPACSHRWCHQPPDFVMKLKKVDFVWINRDQSQFEWFVSMLGRLEREQDVEGGLGGIVDMHMYMTSLPARTDMRGMGLQLALDLVHEDDDTDLFTGLRTRTQGGRPDFNKLFNDIRSRSEGRRIMVFFCGSPLLGTTIKLFCSKYDFGFAHEYF